MSENKVREIEDKIADLKARWPATGGVGG